MNRYAMIAALPLIFSGATVFAQATEQGAAHLTHVFQTYLGTTAGAVTVALDGDNYIVTLNVTPAVMQVPGATSSMTPLELTLTDKGDGTWHVAQDQAISFNVNEPGQAVIKEEIASLKSEGVFDEALMSFTSATGKMSGITITQDITTAGQPPVKSDLALQDGTFTLTGSAAAGGGVDNTFLVTMTGLTGSMAISSEAGAPAMPITYSADSLTETGKIDGMRMDALYKAIAWMVAHPDEAAMKSDKAGLKTILQEGFPLFSTLAATGSLKNFVITTPMGNVGMAEMGIAVDMNGVVPDGKLREAFTVTGLTLPEGIIPTWAVPIVPQKFSVDFQVTDFDAAAAAVVALRLFDLPAGTEPDAAFEKALLTALLPKGTATFGLNPGAVAGNGYELTYQGTMVAGPDMAMPTGTATVTLTGIDKLQAAVAAAPDDIKAQATMGVAMAQGMAKQDGDKLVWEIDASTPGSLSVNGLKMMGGN
jgi:hypothetical protein